MPLNQTLLHSRFLRDMSWRQRLAIILFAFPVLCTLAALLFFAESALYYAKSEPVTGTVVQVYARPGETIFDRGQTNYEPIFTYMDGTRERRASVGSGHSSFAYEVGETATIRAIPGDNGNVRLDTWQGMWFVPVTLSVFAGISLGIAALLWALLNLLVFRKGQS